LNQRLITPQPNLLEAEFSIGICAADHASNLMELLKILENEPYPKGLALNQIVIVASGLDPQPLNFVREFANNHVGLVLIEEPFRQGKAEAINRIIDSFTGQFLVLVNSDAHPERGAIAKLLTMISSDSHVGVVSASPIVAECTGITGAVLQLVWGVHNECLLALNERNKSNHCCDELIVIRSGALRKLPNDVVNDGAFLAGRAYRDGYSIKFCDEAKVKIDVPRRYCDLLRQRRRIVYGHLQILDSMGQSPRTIESMLADDPILSISILIRTLVKSPRLVLVLPIAVIGEVISVALAISDSLSSTEKHVPWDRFGGRA